jgi:hypothetical protein
LFCSETKNTEVKREIRKRNEAKRNVFRSEKKRKHMCDFCLEAKRKIGNKLVKRSEKIDEKFSLKHAKCKQNEPCFASFRFGAKKMY